MKTIFRKKPGEVLAIKHKANVEENRHGDIHMINPARTGGGTNRYSRDMTHLLLYLESKNIFWS